MKKNIGTAKMISMAVQRAMFRSLCFISQTVSFGKGENVSYLGYRCFFRVQLRSLSQSNYSLGSDVVLS